MNKPEDIISDEAVTRVHGRANFGSMTPREVLADGVLKYAMGYSGGHTQLCILMEHKLIKKPKPGKYYTTLTKLGQKYLRAAHPIATLRATPEALAASPEVQTLVRDAEARGMEQAADICNARGAREEANFGLTRAAQNYYRARDDIRKDAAAIRDGDKPGVE